MDKSKAAALIEEQRRRWRSHAPDMALAYRAERVYLGLATMEVCIASALVALNLHAGLFVRIVAPAGFVVGAALLYWQSRRFSQARKLMSGAEGMRDFHSAD
ncbi:MAG TPA: hypothetical protein VFC44_05445 [Candidatus Saccharimonadales bacterium]|nr:hypothetical protein [Candidatus Saccharimonadales bacterium]